MSDSTHRRRWLFWSWALLLAAVAPMPLYMGEYGFAPLLYLVEIFGLVVAVGIVESWGAVSRAFLALGGVQIGVAIVAIGLVAWAAERAMRPLTDRTARRVFAGAPVAAISAGLAFDAYRAPYAQISLDTNLVGVYRWPSFEPVPQPEVRVFDAPRDPAPRDPCLERDPLRRPLFGDTHVHTALSFDAVGQGTRNRPADAYRFAKGEAIGIQPYDRDGRASRTVRLVRPLDWAMVSDHAELLGETHICQSPDWPGHDGLVCRLVRGWTRLGYAIVNGDTFSRFPPVRYAFCGEGGEHCLAAAEPPWAETQRAAEEAYDRSSACAFTSFVGFEWTGMPGGFNAHRNVVFRNEVVPAAPVNYVDTPTAEGLWRELDERCMRGDADCEALAIPHNSNASSGRIFTTRTEAGGAIDAARAQWRSRLEPLVEVTQRKGYSECRSPAGPDVRDARTGVGFADAGPADRPCRDRLDRGGTDPHTAFPA